jgi:hypothetical protein
MTIPDIRSVKMGERFGECATLNLVATHRVFQYQVRILGIILMSCTRPASQIYGAAPAREEPSEISHHMPELMDKRKFPLCTRLGEFCTVTIGKISIRTDANKVMLGHSAGMPIQGECRAKIRGPHRLI